jgi:hypothetical protein
MKVLITMVVILVAILSPAVYADETSKKAIVEELLQIMKVDDQMIKPLFNQMRSAMEKQFIQMGASEDMRPILKRYIDKLLNLMEEDLASQKQKEEEISIYVKVFSEEELKGMLEFYKSPVGQSVLSKMPAVMQESMALAQKDMPKVLERFKIILGELIDEIKAEMKKRCSETGKPC